jgi:glycerate 2-kinase
MLNGHLIYPMRSYLNESCMKDHGMLIKNYAEIGTTEMRRSILDLISDSLSVFDPSSIMKKEISSTEEEFLKSKRCFIIGFGKCSLSMFEGIPDSIRSKASYSGVIVPKNLEVSAGFPSLEILRGNHPIIGKDTEISSRKLLSSLNELSDEDTIIVLISGGGSALFEIPIEGVSYDYIASISKCIMNNGGNIDDLNSIRQIISKVKGGKLAKILYPAKIFSFVISDVPGDREDIIASGPLVKPKTTPEIRREIISKFIPLCHDLSKIRDEQIDYSVNERSLKGVRQKIVLRNHDIVAYLVDRFRATGLPVIDLGSMIQGNVIEVSRDAVNQMRHRFSEIGPFYMVGGGETTVEVKGNGVGGRNCELSVRVARLMEKDEKFLFSSIGTDGIDGVSPAMGGVVDTVFRRTVTNAEIDDSLEKNDTYTLLSRKHAAIITGFTENNVSDIMIGYYGGKN